MLAEAGGVAGSKARGEMRQDMGPRVEARCIWCGSVRRLRPERAGVFTGCTGPCRRGVVQLLNALWRTKLGSAMEAEILGRLRNPPEPNEPGKADKKFRW